jgi:hypothetical protein
MKIINQILIAFLIISISFSIFYYINKDKTPYMKCNFEHCSSGWLNETHYSNLSGGSFNVSLYSQFNYSEIVPNSSFVEKETSPVVFSFENISSDLLPGVAYGYQLADRRNYCEINLISYDDCQKIPLLNITYKNITRLFYTYKDFIAKDLCYDNDVYLNKSLYMQSNCFIFYVNNSNEEE